MTIQIDSVSKRIRGAEILSDISFEVAAGSVVGLSGPNGSGKTMLMRCIAGLVRSSEGEIRIDGEVLGKDIEFPPSIGLLIEGPALLLGRSGVANLNLLASIRGVVGEKDIKNAIELVGLDPDDKRPVRKYSLGMKQRLGIAAAIMERPDLVMLDEPTNALDSSGVEMVKKVVIAEKARGAAVIMSCHDAGVLRGLADEVFYLAEGHLDGHETLRGGGNE